jgi:hypothetical protein
MIATLATIKKFFKKTKGGGRDPFSEFSNTLLPWQLPL